MKFAEIIKTAAASVVDNIFGPEGKARREKRRARRRARRAARRGRKGD